MRVGRRDKLGPRGERVAARYLRRKGYKVLGKNLETRFGEADLLCEGLGGCIVVVEVKARRFREGTPPPQASVTLTKRQRLARILEHLVNKNDWQGRPRRVDVVAIEFRSRGWLGPKPTVKHFENAVLKGGGAR
ncbi:MAG: YraN family protein [Phycisphaera sp.]|nr:MAG: YraN family protein [Phycisphaera sp.]